MNELRWGSSLAGISWPPFMIPSGLVSTPYYTEDEVFPLSVADLRLFEARISELRDMAAALLQRDELPDYFTLAPVSRREIVVEVSERRRGQLRLIADEDTL